MGRQAEAEEQFATATQLNHDLYEAYYFYGRGCFQHGEIERAAELFEQACHARPDLEARYFAAQAYTALGRHEQAGDSYRQALALVDKHMEMNPDDARAATIAAVCHSRLGNQDEGMRWAERALAIDPADARIQYNVACLFSLSGRPMQAIECLKRAVQAGFAHLDWVENDPDLDPVRELEEFKALKWRRE
jgi:tetratricopeptide (TPR) repeat protein